MSDLRDAPARTRAISAHDAHLAVEAGAGTGKTTILVNRLVDAIARGTLTVHRFAAITFTELAAGELEVRLREGLERALVDPAASRLPEEQSVLRQRLEAALAGISAARISTIHAFCSRILREHPVAAGIDPEFTIVAEGFAGSFATASWDEWLRARLDDPDSCRPLLDVLAIGGSLDGVREIAMTLLDHPEVRPVRDPNELSIEQILPTLRSQHRDLVATARSSLISSDCDDRLITELQGIETLFEELESLPSEVALHRLIQLDRLPVDVRGGSRKLYRTGALEELKDAIKQWRQEGFRDVLRRSTNARLVELVDWLAGFTTAHRTSIRREGRLEFRDLLIMTLELFQNSPATLRTVRGELDAVLVDEFQDTDPVQAEIVRLLTEGDGPPYRFVVGDPKQSIYRFRHADVETYAEMTSELARRDQLVQITTNFRSRPRLLALLNAALSELFLEPADGNGDNGVYQAPWTDLEASPYRTDSEGPAIVLLVHDCETQHRLRAEALAAEADALAAALCEVVLGGREIADRHEDWRRRPARWSDCAILLPATTQSEVLEDALEARGVPYLQQRSRSYYRRPEIGELLHVLSAVADPHDETAVVAALRSRFIAIDDTTLARHRRAGGSFTPVGNDGETAVNEAIATIERWHGLTYRQPLHLVVEQVLADTRFDCLLAVTPNGGRAAENVRKLVALAQQFWTERVGDLAGFVRWLSERFSSGAQEREAPGADTANRVTVLSMHGAKGLQWPVVALWDLGHGESPGKQTARVQRPDRLFIRCSRDLMTPGYEHAESVEQAHHRAERIRLLYVAATRAEELLILPLQPQDGPRRGGRQTPYDLLMASSVLSGWAEVAARGATDELPAGVAAWSTGELLEAYPRRDEHDRPIDLEAVPQSAREAAAQRRADWQRDRRQLLRIAGHALAVTPSELHTEDAISEDHTSAVRSRSDALRLGTAVHRALELLLRSSTDPDLSTAVEQAAARFELFGGLLSDLQRLVSAAWSSDLLAEARSAERRWVELPLVWHTTVGSHPALASLGTADQPVLVEGTADLVYSNDEGLVVVDFKTDPVLGEADLVRLTSRYAPQLELYRAALNAAADRTDTIAVLLFVAAEPPRAVVV